MLYEDIHHKGFRKFYKDTHSFIKTPVIIKNQKLIFPVDHGLGYPSLHQTSRSHYRHHSFQVVRQYTEAHFSANALKAFGYKVIKRFWKQGGLCS
jgi:hypothetical protein